MSGRKEQAEIARRSSTPPAANFEITTALVRAAEQLGQRFHIGVIQSKDSFYGQHDTDRMPVSEELRAKWTAWKKLGVLASEMEAAALFTVSAALGVAMPAPFWITICEPGTICRRQTRQRKPGYNVRYSLRYPRSRPHGRTRQRRKYALDRKDSRFKLFKLRYIFAPIGANTKKGHNNHYEKRHICKYRRRRHRRTERICS